MKYPLIISNNHYIAEIGNRKYIIDTGSPISFGKKTSISFAGEKRFAFPLWMLAKESAMLSLVGMPVDGLIGTNLLMKHIVTFDKRNMSMLVDEDVISQRGALGMGMLKAPFITGYPNISIELNGKRVKSLFDTGACISYASKEILVGLPIDGKAVDFSPSIGHFETTLHKSQYSIKGLNGTVRLGNLPQAIWLILKPFGFKAVLGMDLFDQFEAVTLNFVKRRIYLGDLAD